MPSKKPSKSAKKPGKAVQKKVSPKAPAPKKVARTPTKPNPKPVLPKVPVKPNKTASKAAATKPVAAKASRAKAAPTSSPSAKLSPATAKFPAATAKFPAAMVKFPAATVKSNASPVKSEVDKRPADKRAADKRPTDKPAPIKFDIRPMVLTRVLPHGDEDGDLDAPSSASLLAGPRNVKPYISRRGEQYMNKEQLEHFARILQSWKRDLMVEVDRTVLHMKDEAANFPDPNDRATQEEEFSLELRTRDRERKLIRKIDEALKRIEDGSYGYCLETGEEIGIKRLEARPVATLSVEAQERRERREKQYGDRDDRYR
jgi:DnaK suppressor protein